MMSQLEIPEGDKIKLLVSGIQQTNLRLLALSIPEVSVSEFLDRMRGITAGMTESEKKLVVSGEKDRKRGMNDAACKNCGKKGHTRKKCRGEPQCFFCKKKGHRQFDCPERKKNKLPVPVKASVVASASSEVEPQQAEEVVVAVVDERRVINVSDPLVKVTAIETKVGPTIALLDTGSPASFITARTYEEKIKDIKRH